MKKQVRFLWGAIGAWICFGVARGVVPASAPTDTPEIVRWKAVAKKLESEQFSEREAAQKELDQANYRQHDLLRNLAESITDAEAKSRIVGRIQEIEEQIAIDPPPISLTVKNASLDDVCSELSKAMRVKLEAYPPNRAGRGLGTYTLSATEKPFWEIFHDLNVQSDLNFLSSPALRAEGIRITQQNPGMPRYVRAGGIAIFPISITRTASVNFQVPAAQQAKPEQVTLQLIVAADPRMSAQLAPPEFSSIVDELGNSLLVPVDVVARPRPIGLIRSEITWQGQTPLTLPPNHGKTIASAKGAVRLLVQLAEQKITVTDVDKQLKQPLTVGGQTVVLEQLEMNGTTLRFNVRRVTTAQPVVADGLATTAPSIKMTVIDAANRPVVSMNVQGGISGGTGSNNAVPPFKVEFSIATKTKEMVVPFELKDLPLP